MDWFLYNAYAGHYRTHGKRSRIRLHGAPYGADTGLYYVNQRYDQPTLARFTRPDTLYSASIAMTALIATRSCSPIPPGAST